MKRSISAAVFFFLFIGVGAQEPTAPGLRTRVYVGHGQCRENDDPVGLPFRGWVGYTNTGDSISGMTVRVFTSLDKPPVATTITDDAGRFSFPTLGPGKFYLRATLKVVGATITADDRVTVIKGKHRIACLVADGEATDEPSPK